jgi:hypothetical protein
MRPFRIALVVTLVASLAQTAIAQQWQNIAPMHVAREFLQCVALSDGRILAVGGDNLSQAFSDCEIYDPATNTWSQTGSLNIGRTNFSMGVLPNGKVIAAGGLTRYTATTNTCEIYDPATGQWHLTASLSQPSQNTHSPLILTDSTAVFIGGLNANNAANLNNIDAFDFRTETMKPLPPMLIGCWAFQYTFVPKLNGILVAGGLIGGTGGELLRSTQLYSLTTKSWSLLDSLLEPLTGDYQILVLPDSNVYLFSGNGPGGPSNKVERYNTDTKKWELAGTIPITTGYAYSYFTNNDSVITVGGGPMGQAPNRFVSTSYFDYKHGIGSIGPLLNTPRNLHASAEYDYPVSGDPCLMNRTIYVFGGIDSTRTFLSSCEKLVVRVDASNQLIVNPPYVNLQGLSDCTASTLAATILAPPCESATLDSIVVNDSLIRFAIPSLPYTMSGGDSLKLSYTYTGAGDSLSTEVKFIFTTAEGKQTRYMNIVHPASLTSNSVLIDPGAITHGMLNQIVRYPLPIAFASGTASDSLLKIASSFEFKLTFDPTELQVTAIIPPASWTFQAESLAGDTLKATFSKLNSSVLTLDTLGAILFTVIDVQKKHTILTLTNFDLRDSTGIIPFCISDREGGVWVILLDSTASSVHLQNDQDYISEVYPNPSKGTAQLNLHLAEQTQILVQVYDILGREIPNLASRIACHEGNNVLAIAGNGLENGSYFFRVSWGAKVVTREMHLMR